MMTRRILGTAWLIGWLVFGTCGVVAAEEAAVFSPEAQKLLQGNKRYVDNAPRSRDYPRERKEQLKGQKPYALVLTCSDSRVPPEIVFDESLGQLFVIRVAGNVVDPVVAGSMEYAAEHLGSKLVVVLGHSSCGAVKAVLGGHEFPPNIHKIAEAIMPAVTRSREKHLTGHELEAASIRANVLEQIRQLRAQSPLLTELEKKGELQIVGGLYDLETGTVNLFR